MKGLPGLRGPKGIFNTVTGPKPGEIKQGMKGEAGGPGYDGRPGLEGYPGQRGEPVSVLS